MNRAEILQTAEQAVTKDRAATHGKPEDAFGLIAALWSARLGVALTPAQVCIMLIDLKTARAWGNPGHDDNWVDMAGYAACGGEVAGVPAQPRAKQSFATSDEIVRWAQFRGIHQAADLLNETADKHPGAADPVLLRKAADLIRGSMFNPIKAEDFPGGSK